MERGDGFSDWNAFDVDEYVDRCYAQRIMDVDAFIIRGVIDAFRELDLQPGELARAVDVGAGPNLFPALLLAPFLRPAEGGGRLELIDVSRPNRDYLRSVLEADSAGIWAKFEDLMVSCSGRWAGAFDRVRAVAEVRAGDVYALPPENYDAVSSFFVTESITTSADECRLAIEKLIAATRPGGLVVVGHMLGSHGWHAGTGVHFPAVPVTVALLREWYGDHLDGLQVVDPPLTPEVREDYAGTAVVVGRRRGRTALAASTFTTYEIQACLFDTTRVEHLSRAVDEVVRPGQVVVDGGSGSGVLGLLAARAGAARVYCVESNTAYARIIAEHARRNGVADRVVVLAADATRVVLPEPVDVIVCESLSGGLFFEPQEQILANLRRFLRPGGSVVPRAMVNQVELIAAQDQLYGLTFDHDTRYLPLPGDRVLSERVDYLAVDFLTGTALDVDATVTVRAIASGVANAVRIPYRVTFSPSVRSADASTFFLNPQIVFLSEPVTVEADQRYTVRLRYRLSGSPLSARIEVSRRKTVPPDGEVLG